MASATIIKAWQDGAFAYLAVSVAEGGNQGTKEYIGSMSLVDLNALGTNAAKKAALVAVVKAVRDAQIVPVQTDLSAIASGSVTV